MVQMATRNMATSRTLLLFGPGAMSLDELYFSQVIKLAQEDEVNQWAILAIDSIESFWSSICEAVPKLQPTAGVTHVRQLSGWLRSGVLPPNLSVASLPNSILGSLVVIAQLVEYLQYLDSSTESGLEDGENFTVPSRAHTETVGCCLGVFSSLVVSSSASWTQFARNAAVVLRTVFVLGALSDAQDASDESGPSKSLIAFWKGGHSSSSLKRTLAKFPESYVSVLYDDNRATVTTSSRRLSKLKDSLQRAGITTNDVEFHGRFHADQLYLKDLEQFLHFAKNSPAFQLPDASQLVLSTRINSEFPLEAQQNLIEAASRAFLVQQFDWIKTFRSAVAASLQERQSKLIEFGPERCVPPTLLRRLSSQMAHFHLEKSRKPSPKKKRNQEKPIIFDNDIAVVGMACNVAGAEDLEQYWNVLLSGQSQHRELLPSNRFSMETVFRPKETGDEHKKWYGNFINDHDAFDYKFFKKSPREVLHMDPQQRLILQTAYQAVAQSGYYHRSKTGNRVGCYIGVVANDYENNISHTSPTAFSATGALRSYIAGKVSHYFGWTGPGMTVDTACSASTVAIDLACRAIRSGDCTAALAGGTNFYSTPMFFQNLAAGSFLSPTGQCKPFDANADGYCRGEAIGAVFLKKLSKAVNDGDQVLGVIKATSINQNLNSTPIFVPNSLSLTEVFRNVMEKSGLDPKDVSVVEAHGTGTPVGDPVEYDSIRQVLGGSVRQRLKPLQVGSVKGLIGHTEGASGVIALIKILLMMHAAFIPPQASFTTLNPAIRASPLDNMEITTRAVPWIENSKVALINNYGAAGSNASMVVQQAPELSTEPSNSPSSYEPSSSAVTYPVYLAALDEKSVAAYASRLCEFIRAKKGSGYEVKCADLAFNINRQSNWSLGRALIFNFESLTDFTQKLNTTNISSPPPARPVILCFGGQVSKFVGLDRQVYENSVVLKHHLDCCDQVCQAIGAPSIYPRIFERNPIDDPAVLQPLLFAMQYSCAMSWLESGIEVTAVVGHSFGELTALCVSSVLDLENAIKLIYGRSKIIRDSWGPDKGSMVAVEADIAQIEELLKVSNIALGSESIKDYVSIACYNGPTSFTLGGSAEGVEHLIATLSTQDRGDKAIKYKRLNVTNAFHSSLVDGLRRELQDLGQTLSFSQPKLQLERATKDHSSCSLNADYVADHMRQPVFFSQAVDRLFKLHPKAVWLEAGSNSTITTMAQKALNRPKSSHFQSLNISDVSSGLLKLTEATMSLWKAGVRATFWPHSRRQTYAYKPVILPPYQFEKYRHWLEFKAPPKPRVENNSQNSGVTDIDKTPKTLLDFLGYSDSSETKCRFRINTSFKEYAEAVAEYVPYGSTASFSLSFMTYVVAKAIESLQSTEREKALSPQLRKIESRSLITCHSDALYINCERIPCESHAWVFSVVGHDGEAKEIVHLTGELYFHDLKNARFRSDFDRLGRLMSYERCSRTLAGTEDADDVIQGRSIYKILSKSVNYGQNLQLLRKVVGRSNESAGTLRGRRSSTSWTDHALGDNFFQVATIWANYMSREQEAQPDKLYVPTSVEEWSRSPNLLCRPRGQSRADDRPREWHVSAQHMYVSSEGSFITDIFAFNSETRELEEAILGVRYTQVPRSKYLSGISILGDDSANSTLSAETVVKPLTSFKTTFEGSGKESSAIKAPNVVPRPRKPSDPSKQVTKSGLWTKLLPVLADISGLEPEEIKATDSLADIGIDSLMGMEMAREVETTFNCTLEQSELVSITDVPSILSFLQRTLGTHDDNSSEDSDDQLEGSSSSLYSTGSRPTPDSVSDAEDFDDDNTSNDISIQLPAAAILEAFGESKARTDGLLKAHGCSGYLNGVSQKQTRLCLVLINVAFKKLGCDLEAAQPGQILASVPCVKKHQRFQEHLYRILEETRIINIDHGLVSRTDISLPSQSAESILEDLMQHHPADGPSHQLTYNVGSRMADVLAGKADGPELIFGDAKNRDLVAKFYGELPFNRLCFEQMADFLTRLVPKFRASSQHSAKLKILEMGAGTGGTTKILVPVLAKLGVPVEYTFTDLSPSLVAQAKRKFKQYPFMKFDVHDIEKPPSSPELVSSQHIVIASNAVHATHSLKVSTKNIRKFLRPDGFLMMLEMMGTLHWVDVVWGTLEGWWLFDDGRTHAIVDERRWERELLKTGYRRVDWTDGKLPEVRVQRILIALAAGDDTSEEDLPSQGALKKRHDLSDEELQALKAAAKDYVSKATEGFSIPRNLGPYTTLIPSDGACVLITGATGSLGSHILAHLAGLASVQKIYCLNRPGSSTASRDPFKRQIQALESKSIHVDHNIQTKLNVLETDSSKPMLGLEQDQYDELLSNVTHLIHNAFPVNGLRSLKQNEPQFAIMRNLVDLAASVSARREHDKEQNFKFTFQFISSLSAVGKHPFVAGGSTEVPEKVLDIDSALPNGYGGAKVICERILNDTLGCYPDRFRAMTVRLGQLSGSVKTGYWNHMEVLGFLFKSAQTLRSFPAVDGVLSWLPLEQASASLTDLLFNTEPDCHSVYHLDNPVPREWKDLIPVLSDALGIPQKGIVPLKDWLRKVQAYPGDNPWDNPAAKAIEFFEHKFEHMSCGGVTMATENAREHSATLRSVQPVADDVVRKYVQVWRTTGFLR